MKKTLLTIITILAGVVVSLAQPSTFNYQATLRTQEGALISNEDVQLKFSIKDDNNTNYYTELHVVTTNMFGQINIRIGSGQLLTGNFSNIPWGTENLHIQIEISKNNGVSFYQMGESPILAVPYAIYAKSGSGIESVTNNGNGTFTFNFSNGSSYTTSNSSGNNISGSENNIMRYNSTGWEATSAIQIDDTKHIAVGAEPDSIRMLIRAQPSTPDDQPIFQIKNKDGKPVFTVYNNAVDIAVGSSSKGVKGGFAVGGLTPGKNSPENYLTVSPDSVRVYIDNTTKNDKGGFAVGGLNPAKGGMQNYLTVSPDSSRIYFDKTTKNDKGGFAVGGLNPAKGGMQNYLTVSSDSSRIYFDKTTKNDKGGFAVGGLNPAKGVMQNYLTVSSDSSRIYFDNTAKNDKGGFAIGGLSGSKLANTELMRVSNSVISMGGDMPFEIMAPNMFSVYSTPDSTAGATMYPGDAGWSPIYNGGGYKAQTNIQTLIIKQQQVKIDKLEKEIEAIKQMLIEMKKDK